MRSEMPFDCRQSLRMAQVCPRWSACIGLGRAIEFGLGKTEHDERTRLAERGGWSPPYESRGGQIALAKGFVLLPQHLGQLRDRRATEAGSPW